MGKFLDRLTGVQEEYDSAQVLGLPASYTMSREIRRARDDQMGRLIAKGDVDKTDIMVTVGVGAVAMQAAEYIGVLAERAAMRNPDERAGTDAVADAVRMSIANKTLRAGG